jgi:hypothetical protein
MKHNTNNTNAARDTFNGYDTGGYARHYLQLREVWRQSVRATWGHEWHQFDKLAAVLRKHMASDTEVPLVEPPEQQQLPQHERDQLNQQRLNDHIRKGIAMAEAWEAFIDNEPPGLYGVALFMPQDAKLLRSGPLPHRVRVHHSAMGKAFVTTAAPSCIGRKLWLDCAATQLQMVDQLAFRNALANIRNAA